MLLMTSSTSRCRGLLLQQFCQVARLRLHFFKQANIADGDHRLVGEGLKQGYLLFAERMHFDAAKRDRSNALTLAQQRYT